MNSSSALTATTTEIRIGLTVLFIVFLVLKLCHVIEWSWWAVTAPLWGPVLLTLGVFIMLVPILVWKILREEA